MDFFKGLGKGINGAIANYFIDRGSDSYGAAKANDSAKAARMANFNDDTNSIDVVADNPS